MNYYEQMVDEMKLVNERLRILCETLPSEETAQARHDELMKKLDEIVATTRQS